MFMLETKHFKYLKIKKKKDKNPSLVKTEISRENKEYDHSGQNLILVLLFCII